MRLLPSTPGSTSRPLVIRERAFGSAVGLNRTGGGRLRQDRTALRPGLGRHASTVALGADDFWCGAAGVLGIDTRPIVISARPRIARTAQKCPSFAGICKLPHVLFSP